MIFKKQKGYIILGILWIVFSLAYITGKFIPSGSNSIPGIYEFIFLLLVTPIFSVIYGVVSYMLTKQIAIPNFIFAISFDFFLILTSFTSNFFEEIIESLPIVIIIFVISTISSFASKFIILRLAKHKEKGNNNIVS